MTDPIDIQKLDGVPVLVVGLGASGRAAAHFLAERGAVVTANDSRDSVDEAEALAAAGVTRALGGLMSRMRQCAGDQVGIATARIRVSNDGQVQTANIGGRPFGGTPQGDCMENVVKTARFPRFTRTHFDVTYPFSIRPLN